VTLKLKVIGTDAYRYVTYEFLLTFHSNHGPILHRFRDTRRFQSKIANFSHSRVFFVPSYSVFLGMELGIGARGSNDGATRWSKKF